VQCLSLYSVLMREGASEVTLAIHSSKVGFDDFVVKGSKIFNYKN
jgi:hypothetical protein